MKAVFKIVAVILGSTLFAKVANAGEKGGVVIAVAGGITATEAAAIGGLILAVVSFIVDKAISIYFKSQHLKLARQGLAKGAADE